MAGTVDGLGFEEVDQAVTSTAIISGTNIYGATSISGASIRGGNISTAGSVTDSNGMLQSVSLGSPGGFGVIVQAGSFVTTAGSTAAVAFRRNFSTADGYVFYAWPQSGLVTAIMANIGSLNVMNSGTANKGKNTSGVNVVGAASFTYDYFAIGP